MAAPDPITPVVYQNTFKDIPWSEHVPGSPESAFTDEGGRSTRQIIVPWAQLQAAVEAWCGYAEVQNFTAGGTTIRYLQRSIPHCHPAFPWLFGASIPRVEGLGSRKKERRAVPVELGQEVSANDVALYDHALLTVNYTSPEYEILPDTQVQTVQTGAGGVFASLPDDATLKRYVTRICRPAGRVLTIHKGLMRWSDGVPIPEGIGKKVAQLQLTYIWHTVPREAVPFKALQAQIGTINSAAFDPDFWNFPAGTLRFDTVDFRPHKMPRAVSTSRRAFDVQYTFLYEPKLDPTTSPPTVRGWNYEYRAVGTPAKLIPQELRSSWPNGNSPVESSDFNLLFRPDQP